MRKNIIIGIFLFTILFANEANIDAEIIKNLDFFIVMDAVEEDEYFDDEFSVDDFSTEDYNSLSDDEV